ncbi:hypothetical protein UCREL1_6906 [Eutypa lata UCREL1]|uniref:Uncharacterized protein n=1 Tax=Eutypa lata (strain UCR-EL1) TaxID=1287681 RepID=M7T8J4_EUTLA|nr:hypothetical protein UCREL1_6906 [Eutypa lata UCREL1]
MNVLLTCWTNTIRRRAPTTPRTGDHGNFTTYAPEAVIKAFHPKTAAFTVIKDQLREAIGQLGTPRELHTAQGQLQCQPAHDVGDEKWYATRDDMVQAVGEFCDSTAAAGVNPGYLESMHNGQIVSAGWNDDASDCPEIDVTADSFPATCKERLMVPVDECDLVKAHELWKQGGGFYRDCITWYIGNQPQWRDTSAPDLGPICTFEKYKS